jgi:hypothetical protein
MRYRIHKSVLELHSRHFAGLFSRPQAERVERVEG